MRACQGQDVAQALVPGMKLPQAARVLVQALRQREQQPPGAVPVVLTQASSASSNHRALKRQGSLQRNRTCARHSLHRQAACKLNTAEAKGVHALRAERLPT